MIFPEGREHFPDLFNYGTIYFEETSFGKFSREHDFRNTALVQFYFYIDRENWGPEKAGGKFKVHKNNGRANNGILVFWLYYPVTFFSFFHLYYALFKTYKKIYRIIQNIHDIHHPKK